MPRTTRTSPPLQRPPLDADELAELVYDIRVALRKSRQSLRASELAAIDIERMLALLTAPECPTDSCLDDAGAALDVRLAGPAIKLSDPMREYLGRSDAELVEPTLHPTHRIALGPGVLVPGDVVPQGVCPTAAADLLANRDDALGRLHDELTGHVLVPLTCPCHADPLYHQRGAVPMPEWKRRVGEEMADQVAAVAFPDDDLDSLDG